MLRGGLGFREVYGGSSAAFLSHNPRIPGIGSDVGRGHLAICCCSEAILQACVGWREQDCASGISVAFVLADYLTIPNLICYSNLVFFKSVPGLLVLQISVITIKSITPITIVLVPKRAYLKTRALNPEP